MPLLAWQGIGMLPLQEGGDLFVECLLIVRGFEGLSQRLAFGITDVFQYVLAQCSLDNRCKAGTQLCQITPLIHELLPKDSLVTKQMFIQHAAQPVQLHQRVLQRCGREQQLMPPSQRPSNGLPGSIAAAVCITKLMGFIDDH